MATNVYQKICAFFEAENYEVRPDDLRDPTPELVHFLYAKLVQIIFDLDEKNYTKDVAAAAAQLEAHHHERSFSLIKTVNSVSNVCKDLELFRPGEPQFSYADIVTPKRDRTRHVLQEFVEFIETKRKRTGEILQVYDEGEEMERMLNGERFKRDAAKGLAGRLSQDLDSARRKKAEHMRRCVELREKVLELRTEAQKQEQACKKKLDEYSSLEKDIKQARMDLAKASDKNRELETNIVHSPDELNAEINRLEQELQQAFEECEQYAKNAEEFEKDLKRMEDVEHAMENLRTDLQQLESEWEAQAPLRKETDDNKKKMNDVKAALQQLEEQRQAILADQEARRKELKLSQSAQLHEQKIYEQQLVTNKTALKELEEQERQARSESTRLRRATEDQAKANDKLEVDFDAAIEELTQKFLEVKQYMEDRTAEIEQIREIARPVLDRL